MSVFLLIKQITEVFILILIFYYKKSYNYNYVPKYLSVKNKKCNKYFI